MHRVCARIEVALSARSMSLALVRAVRRELGERLVAEGRLSITEIAFLLGFNDVGGFRSAYKRWTGTSPSRGRARA